MPFYYPRVTKPPTDTCQDRLPRIHKIRLDAGKGSEGWQRVALPFPPSTSKKYSRERHGNFAVVSSES